MNKIQVAFDFEKDTKNTVRFKERLDGPLDVPQIGTVYIPKQTLKAIGYNMGDVLQVTVEKR